MGEKSERWAWERIRELEEQLWRLRCRTARERNRAEMWKRRALKPKLKR